MPDLCSTLIELLERQLAGDDAAREEISAIRARLTPEDGPRGPSLTETQAWDVKNLLDEWHGMFSHEPGRRDGLPLVIDLLRFVCRNANIGAIDMMMRDEWRRIVFLRGRAETVMLSECVRCRRRYTAIGTSGFAEIAPLVCPDCGAVTVVSSFSEKLEARCPCGGVAVLNCPSCGSQEARIIEESSPYRYFADHDFYDEE